ncbi:MAG TPA: family 16 glycosylhydrolase, partial [Saprospiraceae bacterium]|nr:family 16 glycosylhydrolase [Saprospiraceae bacterium]
NLTQFGQTTGDSAGSISVKVSLSAASATNVLVNYATLDGTAKSGLDYVGKADGELVFAAGETEKTISLPLIGDAVKENDETFQVLLLNPVNATLSRDKATVTIQNDDSDNPLLIPKTGYTTPEAYAGKTLVWRDEFSANTLDASAWTHELGAGGWGNEELQYYRPENTYFSEGNLIIEARRENFGGSAYTSSRLISKGKKEFTYGRIDIRAALPEGQGIWPALWMLGSNIGTANWPACGEIDIMELVGNQPNRVHGTIHYGANTSQHQKVGGSKALAGTAKFSDEFHVFSLIWEENKIVWLVDDVQFFQATPASIAPNAYPFNQPFFFIFNVAVGGIWPGSPDATTNFPQRMIVDYVRVFQ